jgi:hypothetical protein
MGALPAPGLQYAAGEDSDDPDAAEGEDAAAARAPDMGQVRQNSCKSTTCNGCSTLLGRTVMTPTLLKGRMQQQCRHQTWGQVGYCS